MVRASNIASFILPAAEMWFSLKGMHRPKPNLWFGHHHKLRRIFGLTADQEPSFAYLARRNCYTSSSKYWENRRRCTGKQLHKIKNGSLSRQNSSCRAPQDKQGLISLNFIPIGDAPLDSKRVINLSYNPSTQAAPQKHP
ncbi:MAG: hypothetical protein CM15mV40_050 [Caudoviricetes sp.]|nr:MAG: hypothetical protein CM15mV40_050 [Caudoviricetes sp.]